MRQDLFRRTRLAVDRVDKRAIEPQRGAEKFVLQHFPDLGLGFSRTASAHLHHDRRRSVRLQEANLKLAALQGHGVILVALEILSRPGPGGWRDGIVRLSQSATRTRK